MKKNFLFPLAFLFVSIFGLVSCSDSVKTQSDVSFAFPVQGLYDVLAARTGAADDEAISFTLWVQLYVNGKTSVSNLQTSLVTLTKNGPNDPVAFSFKDIDIGSKVKAKASITCGNITLEGDSGEEVTLTSSSLELVISFTDLSSLYQEQPKDPPESNVIMTFCIQKLDQEGRPIQGSYEEYLTKEFYYENPDNLSPETALDDDQISYEYAWALFALRTNGFEVSEKQKKEAALTDDGKIKLTFYLDAATAPVCKTFTGSCEGTEYDLHLYNSGLYDISKRSEKPFLLGMWASYTDEDNGNKYIEFSEMMVKKDGKACYSPNFYKNGKLIMEGSDPEFDLFPDKIYWTYATQTFELTCYTYEQNFKINFTVSESFDIYAFEESRYGGNGNTNIDSGNYNGGGQISITPTSGLVHISATPSDFYLNTGSVNLKAVTRQEGADVTDSVTWSAKLLYGGVDINDYGAYYSLDTATNSVKLVKNLDAAGTYQLYVTASYNGYTSSQTVDVVVNDGCYYTFDVNANDFATTFGYYDTTELKGYPGTSLQGLPDKSIIKLSGTLDNDSFRDVIGIISIISAKNIELDMWDITGVTQFPLGTDENGKPKLYNLCTQSIASVILPQSFTTIVDGSFADNNTNYYLTSITIPATLTAIEDGGLYNCPKLTEIKLKGSAAAGQNTTYRIDEDGYFYEDKIVNSITETTLLYIPADKKPDLVSLNLSQVYPGVTGFGAGLFKNITTLESVDLSGIISIGKYAFYGCSNLETISNYDGLQYIGKNAFSNCKGGQFNEITLNSPEITIGVSGISAVTLNINFDITQENYDKVRDNVFAGLGFVNNIVLNGETILPDLLESELVGNNIDGNSNTHPKALFYKINSNLQTITFNNTENFKIGDYQFAKFKALTKVITNGGKINEVGNYAFYSETMQPNVLSSIDLSECTRIGDFAFYECRYLKDTKDDNDPTDFALDLSNVQYIGDQAFVNGTWRANDSSNTYHNVISTINLNKVEYIGYRAFFGWTELTTIIDLAKGSINGCVIADEAFAYHNRGSGGTNNNLIMKISSIDLSYVRVIGCSAFRNCSFTSVTIPERVIALGNCVFYPNALKTAPTVSFGALSEGKIGEWYSLTAKSNNAEDINARNSLWSEIITQTVITYDDISAYRNTLSNDCVSQVSNTSTIGQDLGSTTTTKPYYIRVITSN